MKTDDLYVSMTTWKMYTVHSCIFIEKMPPRSLHWIYWSFVFSYWEFLLSFQDFSSLVYSKMPVSFLCPEKFLPVLNLFPFDSFIFFASTCQLSGTCLLCIFLKLHSKFQNLSFLQACFLCFSQEASDCQLSGSRRFCCLFCLSWKDSVRLKSGTCRFCCLLCLSWEGSARLKSGNCLFFYLCCFHFISCSLKTCMFSTFLSSFSVMLRFN